MVFFYSYSQDSIKPDEKYKLARENRSIFVKSYADSLNQFNLNKKSKIPHFFLRYNFDNENSNFKTHMHDETSFRKLIIDKINNTELLRAVLKSKNKQLKKTVPLPKNSIYGIKAFQEYSTYELVKYRLEELINEYSSGKKQ